MSRIRLGPGSRSCAIDLAAEAPDTTAGLLDALREAAADAGALDALLADPETVAPLGKPEVLP